ncbi:hypothetical protein BOW53_08420 [Solemya pervernicosa gill symbiont]|uniref:Chloride channel protein n=2 Tax=Gammaproteobacteria incertae sedis TaxID=118884 RepID=A0A1T2L5E2_9GAMM|nr:chloride channel protein [Candidatus Reidiella endopervernicosa]OOZ40260.1 hypothetical protein BOW53_08420 [Solemya pervernicosa gill symbiont]QKQ26043.1 chloride channel protein [Candidatus Reidiella endopervernicosa]
MNQNSPTNHSRYRRFIDHQRLRLSSSDALIQFAILGVLSGLCAGGVIILFRFLIETTQASFLPQGSTENYEALDLVMRFSIPLFGAAIVALLLHSLKNEDRQVGVVHVMERLSYHQGRLPWKNAVAQFVSAAICIISGHSVGREGPAVHLGAASGSVLGQGLGLHNNTIRTLVGCGTAAAIAASFNTPLAGVIFAMEVVMMEYTIAGFTPVILAAVSATTLTRVVYGSAPAFIIPPLEFGSLLELPYILLTGIVIGTLAALFVHLLQIFTDNFEQTPLWKRIMFAGLIVGVLAIPAPEIMGIGYDTVDAAMMGSISISILLIITLFKLVATTAGLGLGLPGGLIGPTLFIGATAGSAMGHIGMILIPESHFISSEGFYAIIGMGAMMGATLQAPLAALVAILELTYNYNIILPGMLAIIAAGMTSSELFNKGSVFLMLLKARGLDYRNDPIAQSLRRVGVASAMERGIAAHPREISRESAEILLAETPHWILIEDDGHYVSALTAADLKHSLEQGDEQSFDLIKIPGRRLQVAAIHLRETLQEAYEAIGQHGVEALYVYTLNAAGEQRIHGLLTRERVEASYR